MHKSKKKWSVITTMMDGHVANTNQLLNGDHWKLRGTTWTSWLKTKIIINDMLEWFAKEPCIFTMIGVHILHM
jgi:hypothetical protein